MTFSHDVTTQNTLGHPILNHAVTTVGRKCDISAQGNDYGTMARLSHNRGRHCFKRIIDLDLLTVKIFFISGLQMRSLRSFLSSWKIFYRTIRRPFIGTAAALLLPTVTRLWYGPCLRKRWKFRKIRYWRFKSHSVDSSHKITAAMSSGDPFTNVD